MSVRAESMDNKLGLFSVQNRFLLIILLAVLVPVLVTQVVGVNSARSSLTLELDEQNGLAADNHARLVSKILTEQLSIFQYVADNDVVEESAEAQSKLYTGTPEEIQQTLLERDAIWRAADAADNNDDPLVRSVMVNELSDVLLETRNNFPNHVEIFVTDIYGANVGTTGRTSDYYQADEEWWQATWNNGEGAIFVDNSVEFDESAGALSINIGVPIRSVDGEMVGIIRSTYQFQDLQVSVAESSFGQSGRVYIVDRDGRIQIAADTALIGTRLPTIIPILESPSSPNDGVLDRIIDEAGRTAVVSASPIASANDKYDEALNNLGWFLVVLQDEAEAFSFIDESVNTVVTLTTVIVVMSLILGLIFVRTLIRPLQTLTLTAQKLATTHDWGIRTSVTGDDEYGVLGRAFNTMTEELQSTVDDLEGRAHAMQTVVDVSNQIATILDVERLLQDVVDLTKERFDLYHAHIYALDDDGQTLRLTAGSGHTGRQMVAEVRTIALSNRQSIVATAARTREGVISNDVTSAPEFLPHPLLPNTKSELAVPLISRGQVLGVLDVQSDVVDYFTEDIFSVLEILAHQIATALSNATLFEIADRTSRHEQALGAIDRQIQQAVDVDDVLQIAVKELGKALRVPHTAIELGLQRDIDSTRNGS